MYLRLLGPAWRVRVFSHQFFLCQPEPSAFGIESDRVLLWVSGFRNRGCSRRQPDAAAGDTSEMVDDLSALGLRHVGMGGPRVSLLCGSRDLRRIWGADRPVWTLHGHLCRSHQADRSGAAEQCVHLRTCTFNSGRVLDPRFRGVCM